MHDLIKNFCKEECLEFRDDYSGRGMYGKTCVGIVCCDPVNTVVRLCDYIADADLDGTCEDLLGEVQVDSMGTDRIVYFPSIMG